MLTPEVETSQVLFPPDFCNVVRINKTTASNNKEGLTVIIRMLYCCQVRFNNLFIIVLRRGGHGAGIGARTALPREEFKKRQCLVDQIFGYDMNEAGGRLHLQLVTCNLVFMEG